MHVYMAAYVHTYSYMHHFGSREVRWTFLQCIHTQEVSACYTKLIQLQCNATQLLFRGL